MAVERTLAFVGRLKRFKREDSIEKYCKAELTYLTNELSPLSKRSAITNYRNAIRAWNPDHVALKYLKLSADESAQYRADYKTKVWEEQKNLKPLDAEAMISRAEELLKSQSYITVALGLMLLSGRRSTEILKTAEFEYATENSVIFSGQLKTKGSENAQTAPYEIPLLTSSDRFLAGFQRLRSLRDFSDMTNDQINNTCAKGLSIQVKKQFGHLIKGVATKDLRAAYATIAESLYNTPSCSSDVFFATVLGHSTDDLNTAQSYKDFYLV
jgi:integrase